MMLDIKAYYNAYLIIKSWLHTSHSNQVYEGKRPLDKALMNRDKKSFSKTQIPFYKSWEFDLSLVCKIANLQIIHNY